MAFKKDYYCYEKLFLIRLRLLSREGDSKTTPPRADSMLQLLLQGLNNQDRKILNSVLDRADDDLIEKTVKRLPVDAVMPLITELQHYIKVQNCISLDHGDRIETPAFISRILVQLNWLQI